MNYYFDPFLDFGVMRLFSDEYNSGSTDEIHVTRCEENYMTKCLQEAKGKCASHSKHFCEIIFTSPN